MIKERADYKSSGNVPTVRLRVQEIATAKGFNQDRLMRVSGLGSATIGNYWHNRVKGISFENLGILAATLQVPVSELLEEVEPSKPIDGNADQEQVK